MKFTLVSLALLLPAIAISHGYVQRLHQPSRRSAPAPALSARDCLGKYVVAHHMVGNTYPYSVDDWRRDISSAIAGGIDGFALNVGSDSWQADRVRDAYAAAVGTSFKLFMSFDMTSLPCSSAGDAIPLRNYVTEYATHPNQFVYRSRVLVTSFAGSSCTFGQGSTTDGWVSQFISQLTGTNHVWFIPAFFDDVSTYNSYSSFMDGELNWNSAWPVVLTADNIDSYRSNGNSLQAELSGTAADARILSALASMPNGDQKIHMPTVSPWFFTHYGSNSWNKNWIYYSDDFMYNIRWEALIANRAKFDIVQLVTWNDYGESSYVGPIAGAQPNSQAWVDGLDHQAWLPMTKYYADAFKTGSFPAIQKDTIFFVCRPHARDASASSDSVDRPANYKMVQDKVWATVFASQPSTFILSTASNTQTMNITAGVTKVSISINPGDYMRGRIIRDQTTIVDFQPSFVFQGAPQTYNFNAFVAASP